MMMILLHMVFLTGAAGAQPDTSSNTVFSSGEVLQYKVSWNFVRLGTIVVRTTRDSASADSGLYRVKMSVRSNPDLPFISLRELNESLVSSSDATTRCYHARHCNGEDCREMQYSYDCDARKAITREATASGVLVYSDTIGNCPPFVDGPSLLFLARHASRRAQSLNVPTMVNGKLRNTRLNFASEEDALELDDVEGEIVCRRYTGFADWQGGGSAGLTGEFTGWVSDDEAAVPIRAEMKVILGSIVVELERWKRAGWSPPRRSQLVKG